MTQQTILCLSGPTAIGKTDLAIKLAQELPLDIISVDATLVYRGFNIGAAKPSSALLQQYPHALVDIRDPQTPYTAGDFIHDAHQHIQQSFAKQRTPLLIGGTMMYFKSLLEGLADLPQSDPHIRAKIADEATKTSWPELHQQLSRIDPKAAKNIQPYDQQRISRALEVFYQTGQPLSWHWQQSPPCPYNVIFIKLLPPCRETLKQRISERFHHMIKLGFLEEAHQIFITNNLNPNLPAARAVGYRQIRPFCLGEISLSDAIEKSIIASHQLAKRQLTWLRRLNQEGTNLDILWDPEQADDTTVLDFISQHVLG